MQRDLQKLRVEISSFTLFIIYTVLLHPGNLGLYDQRLAMKWVKENIASFGGNPNSITIFGESAGGASVSAQTLSKGSWEWFDRAILQSGNMLMPWTIMTDSQIKDGLNWFLEKVNCKNNGNLLKCLRNVTTDTWEEVLSLHVEVQLEISISPYVDGEFFSDEPQKLWEDGEVKNGDTIIGITKDEMFMMEQSMLQRSKNTSYYLEHFKRTLKSHFKNSSKAVYEKARELYEPSCIPSYLEALKPSVAFHSDITFICASREEAKLRSKLMNSTNVYLFQYSHAPLVPYLPSLYPYGLFGFAGHAIEIIVRHIQICFVV
jgi:carboxylesterase type B